MDYKFLLREEAEKNTLEVLEGFNTRQLLSMLSGVRLTLVDYYMELGSADDKLFSAYKDRIKKVLATREHVPNKLEAKKIRQERAKHKK